MSVEFIERRHEDRRRPPQGIDLARRIVDLEEFRLRLSTILNGCPASFLLDLKTDAKARRADQDWRMMEWVDQSSAALQEWTDGSGRTQEIPMGMVNSRDVLRANVYPSIVSVARPPLILVLLTEVVVCPAVLRAAVSGRIGSARQGSEARIKSVPPGRSLRMERDGKVYHPGGATHTTA